MCCREYKEGIRNRLKEPRNAYHVSVYKVESYLIPIYYYLSSGEGEGRLESLGA